MNRTPSLNLFNSLASWLLIGGVFMWAIGGAAAWGEDSKVPSYTLQEVIDLTLTHNPIIELGKGIIEEKAGEEVIAQSYPNPTFGVQSGYGRVRDPRGTSLIERYFSLSQPLEWPATRAARQQAAEAGVRSAHAGFEETQINVKARVKRRFFELLLAETLADLASRLLNTVTELERAVKRRVESGEAPPFELVKVNVESLQTQKQVSQTKGKVRTNQVALNQLTAGNLGKVFSIQGDFESMKGQLNEQSLTEEAFQHHPEVRKFQQLIEVAGAHYNQEQHARIPNVTISGAFQRMPVGKGFSEGSLFPYRSGISGKGELPRL